ncbi:hypothetical protein [Streptomyces sp. NBC_01353]|uniref:hypothetical protein n=1 Tax=Streptomyces sp. NBC_01353 TaxID=2903835 RepID=UPI002E319457|nr:hypothetical protein [Streptomyces sp. NBC_01353]
MLDAGFFHRGFPADALLPQCFRFGQPFAFGGFAAERELLRDLRELTFEERAGVSAHSPARCGRPPLSTMRSRSDGGRSGGS